MTFNFETPATIGRVSNVSEGIGQRAAAIEFVDLSAEPAKARIVRQGYDVPPVELDLKKVDQFVGTLNQVPVRDLPRVVSQTIPPGTRVSAGTVVDLVLAPRTRIPFDIFANAHADLATRHLDAIDTLVANPAVKRALLTYSSPDDVPAADKTMLQAAFLDADIVIDESNPNRTFARAFQTVRGGAAFQ